MSKQMSVAITAESNFIADMTALVSIANKKGLGKIATVPGKLARLDSLIADAELKSQNNKFALFIDCLGIKGGDPKWVIIAFNKKVQEFFGFSVSNEMTIYQATAIANVRRYAARICDDGIENNLTREVIRNRMWACVEQLGTAHQLSEANFK